MFDTIDNENEKIYLLKELDLFPHTRLFEEHVEAFIKNDHRDLIFDMRNLEVVDSMFLSSIVRFKMRLSLDGRMLRIINYNEHILKCFQLLHLDGHLLG
ncbi:MAG TPA: STAS domain-containing protein [Spirochaetota bacterium]|nr:STAS domain-containing protein [Spirochaetota bacterium]HPS86840.1 STAS domain-containing protein [Spirochaetota bacterium]